MQTKTIWIKAELKGIHFTNNRSEITAECFHLPVDNLLSATPCLVSTASKTLCFAEGIINSSGNALVKTKGDYMPIGKITKDFKMEHGVPVFSLVNEISREAPPAYVKTKAEAEKLCVLAQVFSEGWSVAEVAAMSKIDVSAMDLKNVKLLAKMVEASSLAIRNQRQVPEISMTTLKLLSR